MSGSLGPCIQRALWKSFIAQFAALSRGQRPAGITLMQNANAYPSRLRGCLYIFHGVATHYLPNCLE